MHQRMAGVREITASLQVPTKARARLHLDRKGPEDALNREPGGILTRKKGPALRRHLRRARSRIGGFVITGWRTG